ncbi:MAG TPA: glycosyltransferase family 2 protein [Fimbriiglobus sp.]|jgi:dolichol-phosphate mannosyltransferase
MTPPGLLSLVVPVFNERESLGPLLSEIDAAVKPLNRAAEVWFVDDGSRDGSWQTIVELAAMDPRVRGVKFRRNFGKAAALAAGFSLAAGDIVLTLDADLQDDPAEIPRFLEAVDAGTDVVSGWKKVRHDPWHKVFPSRVFNGMVSRLTGVKLHDHNCGFKAYRSAVVREIHLYGELHRFVPILAAARGFSVGELPIHHRPRKFGRSKFGARRFLKGFFDLVHVSARCTFGNRPMHLFGHVALFAALLALPCIVLAWWYLYATIAAIVLLNFAGTCFLTGLACEFALGANPPSEPYAVAETTEDRTGSSRTQSTSAP